MESAEVLFLDALRCALHRQTVSWDPLPEPDVQRKLIRLAREQMVLPLLVQATSHCPVFGETSPLSRARRAARTLTVAQAARTAEFLLLYDELGKRGLHPAVLKGIVCRSLYPHPEQRASTDEDLLISPEEFPQYHEALLACGLELVDPRTPLLGVDEVSYRDDSRGLYLEVHMRPFPSDSSAYGDCGRLFDGALTRTTELPIYGVSVRTLGETDHLLYLLCHAYKHLLHGGVGVRQLCDIALFAVRFGAVVDWARIREACEQIHIALFATAVFRIGERHFGFPVPEAFRDLDPDELPLLEDCLSGGLYGAVDSDRLHSSTLTLEAVAAQKHGRRRLGAIHSVFLPAASLSGRYPYLQKRPWLLPVAWAQRIWGYVSREKPNPGKSIRIGKERIALLKQYQILP